MATDRADSGRKMSRHRHSMRGHHGKKMATAGRRGGKSNDNIANQLNREEASRIASGMGMQGSSTAPRQMPQAAAPMQGGSMQSAPPSGAPMPNPPASAGQMR